MGFVGPKCKGFIGPLLYIEHLLKARQHGFIVKGNFQLSESIQCFSITIFIISCKNILITYKEKINSNTDFLQMKLNLCGHIVGKFK